MEDVVYLPMRGQFDVVYAWTNHFCNLERSEVFGV
jgi:hypothetical protein